MQLRVLKLEDGEYAKANGGFSLIRAGVAPLKPARTAPPQSKRADVRPSSTSWLVVRESV